MRFASDPAIHSTEVEQCVRRHQAGVWHYLRLLGADPEAADDLAQETFLVMLRKGFVAKAPEATACYLRRTARFLFLEHRRRSKSGRWEQDSGAWDDAVDAAWAAGRARDLTEEWLAALRRCRDRLAGALTTQLGGTNEITSAGLRQLSRLQRLRELDLTYMRTIQVKDLRALRGLPLESLNLFLTKLDYDRDSRDDQALLALWPRCTIVSGNGRRLMRR